MHGKHNVQLAHLELGICREGGNSLSAMKGIGVAHELAAVVDHEISDVGDFQQLREAASVGLQNMDRSKGGGGWMDTSKVISHMEGERQGEAAGGRSEYKSARARIPPASRRERGSVLRFDIIRCWLAAVQNLLPCHHDITFSSLVSKFCSSSSRQGHPPTDPFWLLKKANVV